MQAICEPALSPQQTTYLVAGQSIVVETHDNWAARVIEELFAGWYLTPDTNSLRAEPLVPAIVIKSSVSPFQIPPDWQQFEIAGGGQCYTNGQASYIDIEGSIVAIGQEGSATVGVWTNGPLEIQSPVLTRVVTYALAAALRRRRLFELHSGAVIDPDSGTGVLIIGPSGSGKSTLTVQLATAGWPFLTDDVLLLSSAGDEINAWPLRRCFAVTAETFSASNFLQARTSLEYLKEQRDDKQQFAPHGVFVSEFRENCTPRRLFFTQLSGGQRSQISRLSPGETMARLIRMNPWSCYDRTTAADHLAVLSKLVKQSIAYSLLAARDLLDPAISASLIARHTRD